MSEKRELICVSCPIGCNLTVTLVGGKIIEVTGNNCKRGLLYAQDEVTSPRRVLTSTVRTTKGNIVSVKSAAPLPKGLLFDCMKLVNAARPEKVLRECDVVIKNILDTGVDIVATKDEIC